MEVKCRIIDMSEFDKAFEIRRIVFIEEQDVPYEIERDELDESELHMVCEVGDKIVGTGRLNFFEDTIKMCRVAVLRDWRGKGIGSEAVRFLILAARERSDNPIYANVQVWTKEFYARFGFKPVGAVFLEADIEHIRMEICAEK